MNIVKYNKSAWNREVEKGNEWTVPVDSETIARARRGDWSVVLTPTKPVPRDWYPPLKGLSVLCLASGGGQQGPIFAAVGANVTVLDNCPKQLEGDRLVAERDSMNINTVEGDMKDLSRFEDGSFELIFHPVSNTFVDDVRPVWKEAFRVLKKGGVLLAGFMNPAVYLFDWELAEKTGELRVKYKLPYADITDLDENEKQKRLENNEPMEFSHTLTDQIGGQLEAGFITTSFFEDSYQPFEDDPLPGHMDICIATRAVRP